MTESFSEQGQDLFALSYAYGPLKTFLDIGCHAPVLNNNTYGLELRGWRGALVDVDSQWEEPCRRLRKSPFVCQDAREINWTIFCAIHNIPSVIGYLSLDVDDDYRDVDPVSKTLKILKRMIIDDGLIFRVITVEHDAYRLGDYPRSAIRKFLEDNGYGLVRGNVSCRPPEDCPFEDWFVGPILR